MNILPRWLAVFAFTLTMSACPGPELPAPAEPAPAEPAPAEPAPAARAPVPQPSEPSANQGEARIDQLRALAKAQQHNFEVLEAYLDSGDAGRYTPEARKAYDALTAAYDAFEAERPTEELPAATRLMTFLAMVKACVEGVGDFSEQGKRFLAGFREELNSASPAPPRPRNDMPLEEAMRRLREFERNERGE